MWVISSMVFKDISLKHYLFSLILVVCPLALHAQGTSNTWTTNQYSGVDLEYTDNVTIYKNTQGSSCSKRGFGDSYHSISAESIFSKIISAGKESNFNTRHVQNPRVTLLEYFLDQNGLNQSDQTYIKKHKYDSYDLFFSCSNGERYSDIPRPSYTLDSNELGTEGDEILEFRSDIYGNINDLVFPSSTDSFTEEIHITKVTIKDESPFVRTDSVEAQSITANTATLHGRFTNSHGRTVTEMGFHVYVDNSSYDASPDTTYLLDTPVSQNQTFELDIDNLTHDTRYYFRAYAKNSWGEYTDKLNTFYFDTPDVTPVVNTPALNPDFFFVRNNQVNGSATVEVTDLKGYDGLTGIDSAGVMWSLDESALTAVDELSDIDNIDIFSNKATINSSFPLLENEPAGVAISGLLKDTTYYFKAYVSNSDQIVGFGDVKSVQTPANSPPDLTLNSSTASYTENASSTFIDITSLSDADGDNISEVRIQISNNYQPSEDTLTFAPLDGNGVSFDSYASGTLTLTGNASTLDYIAALQAVEYANSSDDPTDTDRTISIQLDDANGAVYV
jgi:hypothetical protein